MRFRFGFLLLLCLSCFALSGAGSGKKESAPPAEKRKIFHASAPLTPPVTGIIRVIENNMAPWAVESAVPLEKLLRYRFAAGGWKIVLTRPLTEENAVQAMSSSSGVSSNTAEIVLLPVRDGLEPACVRPYLLWSRTKQEMYNTICFLGRTGIRWYVFARADVVTLDTLLQLFNCQGGDPMEKILAEALLAEDTGNLTRRNVPSRISRYGDKALPLLRLSLGKALAARQDPVFVFNAVKALDTPAAAAEIMRGLRSGEPSVERAAAAAMNFEPYMKSGTEIYRYLLKKHQNTDSCIAALTAAGDREFLTGQLTRMKSDPRSYLELASVNFALVRLRTGRVRIPENDIVEQICMMFARTGDLPGSPKMVSMQSVNTGYSDKVVQEEKKRIQPLIDRMLASRDTDTAIICTLFLVLFSPEQKGFSAEYVSRINRCGLSILSRLPRRRVLQILDTLRDHVIQQKESEIFARLAARLR